MGLKLAKAQVTGPPHIRKQGNRQDMMGIVIRQRGDDFVASVIICDGGSPGNSSEVGAGIVAQKVAIKLDALVLTHGNRPTKIATELHAYIMLLMRNEVESVVGGPEYLLRLDEEIRHLAELGRPADLADFTFDVESDYAMQQVSDWIQHNLLFTFVAVYNTPEGTIVFQRGDGGVYVDGELIVQSFDNVNPYFGYALATPRILYLGDKRLREQGFDLTSYRNASKQLTHAVYPNAKNIALFSDGMPTSYVEEFIIYAQPVGVQSRNKAQKRLNELLRQSMLHEDVDKLEGFLSRTDLSNSAREGLSELLQKLRIEANVAPLITDDASIFVLSRE